MTTVRIEVVDAQLHGWDVDSSRHPRDPKAVAELLLEHHRAVPRLLKER